MFEIIDDVIEKDIWVQQVSNDLKNLNINIDTILIKQNQSKMQWDGFIKNKVLGRTPQWLKEIEE